MFIYSYHCLLERMGSGSKGHRAIGYEEKKGEMEMIIKCVYWILFFDIESLCADPYHYITDCLLSIIDPNL